MTKFEEAFEQVKQMAADFKANEAFYLSAQFSEAQARKDFIDKFFIALGWDVNHGASLKLRFQIDFNKLHL